MSKKSIVITDLSEVYDSPIAELVQEACKFSSEILLNSGTYHINAKSIMGVMALSINNGLSKGTALDMVVTGDDESAAISAMERFLTKSAR